jgi:uncharacterized phage-associated protein
MIDFLNVAPYFIKRAYQEGTEMTNMKVQKLLYYSQSLHLALFDEPLFENEIQAWRYGPVCPPAYRFYSEFGDKQLPMPEENVLSEVPNETKYLLEKVWDCFSGYHAYLLSDRTHNEFPWLKAREGLPIDANSAKPIPQEDLKALGHQTLDWIERENPLYEPLVLTLLEDVVNLEPSEHIGKGQVRDWLESLLD